MLAAISTFDTLLIVLAIVIAAPPLGRLIDFILNLFRPTTLASWGIVLEGQGQRQEADAVLLAIRTALEAGGHKPRVAWFDGERYAQTRWGDITVYAGAHMIHNDLYVSWTSQVHLLGSKIDERGFNGLNFIRGFLNATLAAVQNAVELYVREKFGPGAKIRDEQRQVSGVLGPLGSTFVRPSAHEPDASFGDSLLPDADGFLRRECGHCERAFKWLHRPSAAIYVRGKRYFCPYCRETAWADILKWLTWEQAEWLEAAQRRWSYEQYRADGREALNLLDEQSQEAVRAGRSPLPLPDPPPDPPDMRRIDFKCHPDYPLKVREDWDGSVYCLVCGSEA